jgi:two-component system sensor histidine kinase QseC
MRPDSGSWWQRLFRPSLARRLLLAQVALMMFLWILVIGFATWGMLHEGSEQELDRRFALLLVVADNLAEQPERLQETFRAIDQSQRDDDAIPDEPDWRVSMIVWQGEKIAFASPGLENVLLNTPRDGMQTIQVNSHRWRAITRKAPRSDIRVTLLGPSAAIGMLWTLTLKGFLVMPLIISLPLLILPAWLSVKLALRPWAQLSDELASRGPRDLNPLAFRAKHRELFPLVRNLNALLQRVRDSMSREHNFIADAAHELRTPLAAMRVNVEALQRHVSGYPQSELLDGVLRSVSRATRLVAQLLTLMRNEATAAATEQELDELVRERLAMLSGLAAERRIELELNAENGVCVAGDTESLVSMIDNLVENAIKYSPTDSTVTVSVARVAGHAVLTVADQGPGIPAEQHARVFDRFFRAPEQPQTGSGLGLAIVKSAVERSGGTIDLSAGRTSQGLVVQVLLPACAGS